uniref:MATH domain-containing protein n=1 Tax=Amphimedon queenslandica TaxID=400682 RepID=A0A1X7TK46_AMPQE
MEICFNHKNLQKFAEFLCNSPATRNMGNIIMQDYVKELVSYMYTFCTFSWLYKARKSKSIKISVSSDKSDEFEERRADLASTLVRIIDVVIGIGVEVEKLKEYLRICYARLNPIVKLSINECKTTAEIIEWIGERCSLTKIRPLEQVMEHFEIKKAISIIQEYNIRNQNFKEKTSLHQCLDKLFSMSSVLQLEKAVFVVNKRVEDCTIKDIEEFIDVALEDLSVDVRVSVIKKGNSFSIFCSFPVMLSESLILTALKNLKVLKDNGLLKLTIGYCTVYDYKDQSLCYPEEGEALDEYISAVYASRGTLEQLLISASLQLMYREEQNKEDSKEIRAFEKKIEFINERLSSFQDLSENMTEKLKQEIQDKDRFIAKVKKELLELKEKMKQDIQGDKMKQDIQEDKMKQDIQEDKMKQDIQGDKMKQDIQEDKMKQDIQGDKMKQDIQEDKDFLIDNKTKEISKLKEKLNTDGEELISLREKLMENEKMKRAYQTQANRRIPTLNFVDDDVYTPPVDVIMMSFDKYNKLDEDWYSRAFYTHTNGYKMCLCIRYDDKKKSSNLHAHLMAGDHDDDLQWPFRGTLITEILHRKTKTFRYLAEIIFDDDKFCGRVWNGVPTEAGIASSIVGEGISFVQEPFTEYLEDNSIVIRVKSVNVESLVRTSAITSPPPIKEEMLFEIAKFSHHKKSNSECISEGFYSAKGYKFVLMVYPNGRSHFQGRSVSIFAHISMGDYDNELTFPFRGKIIVQIVNQFDRSTLRNHIEKTIEFTDKTDPEERFGARVTGLTRFFGSGHSHQGFGYHDMLRHEFLMFNAKHRTEYLKDDRLIVRVTKIEDYNV